ncbi:MAG: hypothetical protein R6W67_03030 [Bacteroidales bacterium]
MTDIERREIEKIIVNEIDKLNKQLEVIQEFTKPVAPDNAIGRVSRMEAGSVE